MSSEFFEVKIKRRRKVFSKHFEANSMEQAAHRASNLGKIIGVRKVRKEDVIGEIEVKCKDVICKGVVNNNRVTGNPILDDVTATELIFGNGIWNKRGVIKEESNRLKEKRKYNEERVKENRRLYGTAEQ